MAMARFMATPAGRGLRIVLGAVLLLAGIATAASGASVLGGTVLIAVGAVLVAVGSANVCPLAVPFGGPFDGRAVRGPRR